MQRHANDPLVPKLLIAVVFLALSSHPSQAQPSPAALAAFSSYTQAVEHRLAQQHATTYLAPISPDRLPSLQQGDLFLEPLTESHIQPATGAMLHHWRGTAFVPGAHAADFDHLLRDLPAYPRLFAPEVLRASLLTSTGDHMEANLRVRQHHVLTVTLDTAYDVTFSPPNATRGWSQSRSVRIAEIANPDTPGEHALSPADEHGFLYRLNTYWTWEERSEGLYLQIETVSLSRAIPPGLGWALRPYTDSVPRDSLTFTLTAARNALQR
jgi:hypothetical protein